MSLFHGREADFETAYDKYADMLYRLALSHLNNSEDAQDVVHDVFVKYMSTPKLLTGGEHERAWFVRVTVNQCHDFLRKKKYRNHADLDEIIEMPKQEQEKLPDIVGMVSKLPEKYKSVVILHYLEGYSVDEVAKMLRISASAVKMRLSRGREMLKNILEKEERGV